MKKLITKALIIMLAVITFSGCSGLLKRTYVIEEAEIPPFTKQSKGDFDVLELAFKDGKPLFTDIGDVKEGVYRLTGDEKVKYVNFAPEYLRSEETGGYKKTGIYKALLPDYYFKYVQNQDLEGIIVYKKVPFAIYYNEKNELCVKCFEYSFDSYFRDSERSYIEFLNFAVNYVPKKITSPESEITSGGVDGC